MDPFISCSQSQREIYEHFFGTESSEELCSTEEVGVLTAMAQTLLASAATLSAEELAALSHGLQSREVKEQEQGKECSVFQAVLPLLNVRRCHLLDIEEAILDIEESSVEWPRAQWEDEDYSDAALEYLQFLHQHHETIATLSSQPYEERLATLVRLAEEAPLLLVESYEEAFSHNLWTSYIQPYVDLLMEAAFDPSLGADEQAALVNRSLPSLPLLELSAVQERMKSPEQFVCFIISGPEGEQLVNCVMAKSPESEGAPLIHESCDVLNSEVQVFSEEASAETLAAALSRGILSIRDCFADETLACEKMTEVSPLLNYANCSNIQSQNLLNAVLDNLDPERLTMLNVSNTPITSIPERLTHLKALTCYHCSQLTSLPDAFDRLELLDVRFCTRLERLPPVLGQCTRLELEGAHQLHLQELPQIHPDGVVRGLPERRAAPGSFHLFRASEAKMEVPYEEIPHNPLPHLEELNKHLEEERSFPRVYFVDAQGVTPGIDVGGLKKELICLLMGAIASKYVDEKGCLTPSALSLSQQKALGNLLALCAAHPLGLTTGAVFSLMYYEALSAYNQPLKRALVLLEFPKGIEKVMMEGKKPTQKECEILSFLIDPDLEKAWSGEELLKMLKEEPKLVTKVNTELMEQLKHQDLTDLYQVSEQVGKALFESPFFLHGVEPAERTRLQTEPGSLRTLVEGELNSQLVLQALSWGESRRDVHSLKKWVEEWIQEASLENLRGLVRFATARNTLPRGATLTIKPVALDPEIHLFAHTCINALDLPEYESQEDLNLALNSLGDGSSGGFNAG